ncbi:MAG: hypothetical protein WAT39_00675 [Planctomycetota bacterium]
MSLHRDLLEQARHLAKREPKKPRQASLRRAIGTSYYALFHLLVHDACAFLAGGAREPLRHALARAFKHKAMVMACKAFANQAVKDPLRDSLPTPTISPDLTRVATTFADLQQARHEADYDPSAAFSRQQALGLVNQAVAAFAAWDRVRKSEEVAPFCVALLAYDDMRS